MKGNRAQFAHHNYEFCSLTMCYDDIDPDANDDRSEVIGVLVGSTV